MMLKSNDFSEQALSSMEDLRTELVKRQMILKGVVHPSRVRDTDPISRALKLVILALSLSVLMQSGFNGRFDRSVSVKKIVTTRYEDISRVLR